MAVAAILKIAFLTITHQPFSNFSEILYEESERHVDKGYMTKSANFLNPRWPTAAILKIVKSPYLSEKLSDFDEIRYTTLDIEPDDSHVTKIEIFEIKDGGDRHLENRFCGHNSSTDFPISAKLCVQKQNGMPTKAT